MSWPIVFFEFVTSVICPNFTTAEIRDAQGVPALRIRSHISPYFHIFTEHSLQDFVVSSLCASSIIMFSIQMELFSYHIHSRYLWTEVNIIGWSRFRQAFSSESLIFETRFDRAENTSPRDGRNTSNRTLPIPQSVGFFLQRGELPQSFQQLLRYSRFTLSLISPGCSIELWAQCSFPTVGDAAPSALFSWFPFRQLGLSIFLGGPTSGFNEYPRCNMGRWPALRQRLPVRQQGHRGEGCDSAERRRLWLGR